MFPFSGLALDLASQLLEGARTDGGATVDVAAGPAPTDGYMVGVPGYGIVVPLEVATLQDVAEWVTNTRRHVLSPDTYLGSWVSNGAIYLDVSQRFTDREVALIVASQRGELAIWDVANGDEITV